MFDTLGDSRILGMGDVVMLIENAEDAGSELEVDEASSVTRSSSRAGSTTSGRSMPATMRNALLA